MSKHFDVGTYVVCNNQRGQIIGEAVFEDCIRKIVCWADGSISTFRRPL